MTQDEIIRMAREVWGERAILPFNELERFAALVAAHEREQCAKVCDEHGFYGEAPARDIRARGDK